MRGDGSQLESIENSKLILHRQKEMHIFFRKIFQLFPECLLSIERKCLSERTLLISRKYHKMMLHLFYERLARAMGNECMR